MTRFAIPIALFALLAVALSIGLTRDPSRLPSPLVGKNLPEFTLPNLLKPETPVGSRDMTGRYTLLNVWASWCFACRQEHGFLLELTASNTIPVYGLNWRDERSAALRWIKDLGDPYAASAFDGDGRVGIDLGVYGAPETFLIAPDGRIVHKHVSPLTRDIWEREFLPLIGADGDG